MIDQIAAAVQGAPIWLFLLLYPILVALMLLVWIVVNRSSRSSLKLSGFGVSIELKEEHSQSLLELKK